LIDRGCEICTPLRRCHSGMGRLSWRAASGVRMILTSVVRSTLCFDPEPAAADHSVDPAVVPPAAAARGAGREPSPLEAFIEAHPSAWYCVAALYGLAATTLLYLALAAPYPLLAFGLPRSALRRPECHRGEWHTCDDPKLRGKWHWSCCDHLEHESHCTRLQWAVRLKRATVGLLPRSQCTTLATATPLSTPGKGGKKKRK
jgi:hypothetical protein